MPAGEELAGARQAVTTLLPLAVQAAGGMRPDEDRHGYLTRVRQLAVDLWLETATESETVRRIAELAACRTFPAVLLGVRVEPSTTRAILTLRSWGPDGERQEEIRTDRTDDPRGVQTLELARTLIGHRVTVYKLEEPGRSGYQRYRCAKHLVDLGPADPRVEPAPAGPAPAGPAPDAARRSSAGPTGERPAPDRSTDLRPAPDRSTDLRPAPDRSDPGPALRATADPATTDPATTAPSQPSARRPTRRRAATPTTADTLTADPSTADPSTADPSTADPAPEEADRPAPRPAVPAGASFDQARAELLAVIGGDEEYRTAALHGILRRAAVDDEGTIVNVALLRMLAARTPEPDSAAGRKILADYRASAPAG